MINDELEIIDELKQLEIKEDDTDRQLEINILEATLKDIPVQTIIEVCDKDKDLEAELKVLVDNFHEQYDDVPDDDEDKVRLSRFFEKYLGSKV